VKGLFDPRTLWLKARQVFLERKGKIFEGEKVAKGKYGTES